MAEKTWERMMLAQNEKAPLVEPGNPVLEGVNKAFGRPPAAIMMFRKRLPDETVDHYMREFSAASAKNPDLMLPD